MVQEKVGRYQYLSMVQEKVGGCSPSEPQSSRRGGSSRPKEKIQTTTTISRMFILNHNIHVLNTCIGF